MKTFDPHIFDPVACRSEVMELDALLKSRPSLHEKRDILPFFRKRRQLSALLSAFHSRLHRRDLIAYEYDLFGDFAADLAIGDSISGAFMFVEFEDASPDSLFVKRKGKASPEWASRFEHGFSQVVDWFFKLNDMHYQGLLVIGRDQHLGHRELKRLNWRTEKVVVNSLRIHCRHSTPCAKIYRIDSTHSASQPHRCHRQRIERLRVSR